jgi:hypothetical protein
MNVAICNISQHRLHKVKTTFKQGPPPGGAPFKEGKISSVH